MLGDIGIDEAESGSDEEAGMKRHQYIFGITMRLLLVLLVPALLRISGWVTIGNIPSWLPKFILITEVVILACAAMWWIGSKAVVYILKSRLGRDHQSSADAYLDIFMFWVMCGSVQLLLRTAGFLAIILSPVPTSDASFLEMMPMVAGVLCAFLGSFPVKGKLARLQVRRHRDLFDDRHLRSFGPRES